jgi:hypothetical protein
VKLMTYAGRMRLHFNRHGADPLMWCVSTDQWELAVPSIICDAPMRAVYRKKDTPDDEDGKPSAWFEVDGFLSMAGDGTAVIEHHESCMSQRGPACDCPMGNWPERSKNT